MRTRTLILASTLLAVASPGLADSFPVSAAVQPPYRRADLPVDARVADLLGRMTLAEKLDQLHQIGLWNTNPNNLAQCADELRPTYGSFIVGGPPETLLVTRNAVQRRAVEETRLGIPALFAADVIHGYRAIVPIPLAQACAWDPALVERAAAQAAAESRAHGIDWTFAPMVDHCVDPRWGRIAETFGESPYAGSVFSASAVRGFQGAQPGAPGTVAACLKHYVGYGASEGGRDYVYTGISVQELWDNHLPPFAAGVRAGALTVMSAFNDLSGVPTSANAYTLTEILRHRWNFHGVVVSDWAAVAQLVNQGFAADGAEAAQKALAAGVDIDMASGLYRQHGADLVAAGRLPLAAVDEAVRRVLRVKFELGLFERPYAEANALTGAAPNEAQLALAEEFAARSMVLLKNDGVLPLTASEDRLPLDRLGALSSSNGQAGSYNGSKKVALVGPLAVVGGPLLGCWAQQGRWQETPSIADALRTRLPADVNLAVEAGCSIQGDPKDDLTPAIAAAEGADLAIVCVGEEGWMSGENASRSTLRLAGRQEELVRAVLATGKPVVLVIVSGRPIDIHEFESRLNAVVAAWGGGSRAGAALADLLLGRRNFAGRLAVTWPATAGQIPLYHHMRPRARTGDEGAYRDFPTAPLYPFGHGLGYTTFAYSPIRLSKGGKADGGEGGAGLRPAPADAQEGRSETDPTVELRSGEKLTAEVTVTNTGAREGVETVFWFIRDPAASITRPLQELKHFEQAALAPGASRVFRFEIEPACDLAFPDADGRPVLEPGEIILMAGGHRAPFRVQP